MTTSDDGRLHLDPTEELRGEYETECSFCKMKGKITIHTSVGWAVGDTIGKDTSDPTFGRCNRCRRYALVVVRTPSDPVRTQDTGFTKIPTT